MKMTIARSNEGYGLAVTGHPRARMLLLFCGIAASVTWLVTDIRASLSYESYSFPFDPISGLSAVDAPTRLFVALLLNIYVILKAAFSLGVWSAAGRTRALRITAGLLFAWVLVDLASSFFPWHPAEPVGSFANMMHSILAGVITVLLIFLTIGFGATADGKWFRFYSYGTLLLMIVLGALPLLHGFQITVDQPPQWFGAGERINAYGYMLWMIALAVVLLRNPQKNL